MNTQSRRSFCQLCLMAGAGLAGSFAPALAAEGPGEESKQVPPAEPGFDYAKVGYCGYRCDICPGRSEDRQTRRKMVDGWIKLYGHTSYTDENVPVAKPCAGCKGSGEIADVQCPVRPCASGKRLVLCADCDQFPCEKLRSLLGDRYWLLMRMRGKAVTLEEYTMSAMQFESMPVLLRRMADTGKLPAWVKELV